MNKEAIERVYSAYVEKGLLDPSKVSLDAFSAINQDQMKSVWETGVKSNMFNVSFDQFSNMFGVQAAPDKKKREDLPESVSGDTKSPSTRAYANPAASDAWRYTLQFDNPSEYDRLINLEAELTTMPSISKKRSDIEKQINDIKDYTILGRSETHEGVKHISNFTNYATDLDKIKDIDTQIDDLVMRYDAMLKNQPNADLESYIKNDTTYQSLMKEKAQVSSRQDLYNKALEQVSYDTGGQTGTFSFLHSIQKAFTGIDNEAPTEVVNYSDELKKYIVANLGDSYNVERLAQGGMTLEEKEDLVLAAKLDLFNEVSKETDKILKDPKATEDEKIEAKNRFSVAYADLGYDMADKKFAKQFEKSEVQEKFVEKFDENPILDTLSTFGNAAVQTAVGYAIQAPAEIMAGVVNLFYDDDHYSSADKFIDSMSRMTGFNYLPSSKEKGLLINDNGEFDFSWYGAGKGVAEALPFTLGLLASMKSGKFKLDTSKSNTITKLLEGRGNADKLYQNYKLVTESYRMALGSSARDARDMGLRGEEAALYGNAAALMEGVTGLIMPDVNYFKGAAGKLALNQLASNLKKATTKEARSAAVKSFFTNIGKEIGEEEAMALYEDMAKTVAFQEHEAFSDFADGAKQMQLATVTIGLSGLMGGFKVPKDIAEGKASVYRDIATNSTLVKKILDDEITQFPEKKEDLEKVKSFVDNVSDAVQRAPEDVSVEEVQLLTEKVRLQKEMENADDSYKEMYQRRIDDINNKIVAKQEGKTTGVDKLRGEFTGQQEEVAVEAPAVEEKKKPQKRKKPEAKAPEVMEEAPVEEQVVEEMPATAEQAPAVTEERLDKTGTLTNDQHTKLSGLYDNVSAAEEAVAADGSAQNILNLKRAKDAFATSGRRMGLDANKRKDWVDALTETKEAPVAVEEKAPVVAEEKIPVAVEEKATKVREKGLDRTGFLKDADHLKLVPVFNELQDAEQESKTTRSVGAQENLRKAKDKFNRAAQKLGLDAASKNIWSEAFVLEQKAALEKLAPKSVKEDKAKSKEDAKQSQLQEDIKRAIEESEDANRRFEEVNEEIQNEKDNLNIAKEQYAKQTEKLKKELEALNRELEIASKPNAEEGWADMVKGKIKKNKEAQAKEKEKFEEEKERVADAIEYYKQELPVARSEAKKAANKVKKLEDKGVKKSQPSGMDMLRNAFSVSARANTSEEKSYIAAQAEKARMAVSKIMPNLKIKTYNTTEEYAKAIGTNDGSRGTFNYKTGEIHIDLSVATRRTVGHEVFHAVLFDKLKTEENIQKYAKQMVKSLANSRDSRLLNTISSEILEAGYEIDVQNEEIMSELFGGLASEFYNLNGREQGIVKQFIDKVAKFLGLKSFTNSEITELLNTLSGKVAEGEIINAEDLAALDINETGLSGLIRNVVKKSKSLVGDVNLKRFPINPKVTLTENVPLSNFNGKRTSIIESDRMTGAYIEDVKGNPLYKFFGGLYFPIITGKVWASGKLSTAQKIAKHANKNRDADGYVYMTPMLLSQSAHMSNRDMFEAAWELMKHDLQTKGNSVTKEKFAEYVQKALSLSTSGVKERSKGIVVSKNESIKSITDKLDKVLVGEDTTFTFDQRITIINSLLGKAQVRESRRFPSAGSMMEFAEKFEEERAKGADLWDIAMIIRTKGTLNARVTEQSDEFYHKSYPAEIYSDAPVEVIMLDGKYSITDAIPVMRKSNGDALTFEEYANKHKGKSAGWILNQYGRTAKLALASGELQGTATKKQKAAKPSVAEVREWARKNGISAEDVNKFLREEGYSERDINEGPAIDKIYEENDKELNERLSKPTIKERLVRLREHTLDRQQRIKDLINGISTPESLRAANLLVNKAGASGYANYRFKQADKKIFDGLNKEDASILDKIIYAKRIIAINKNRATRGMKAYEGKNSYTSDVAQDDLNIIKSMLGEKKFNDLDRRSEDYFSEFRDSLLRLKDAQLISEDVYNDLKDIEYSPIKTIEYLIPESATEEELNRYASITGMNGEVIKKLGEINQKGIIMDSRWLLMNNISLIEAVVAENKLMNAFYDAYESADADAKKAMAPFIKENARIGTKKNGNPEYEFDTKKIPVGFTKVNFKQDGQNRYMVISTPYANQLQDVKKDQSTLKAIGKYTGGSILRFFATSGNPLFIVGNTAVDFTNILFLSNVYSKNKFVGGGQLAADAVKNFIRKASNTGTYNKIYREYMENGGAMDYMSSDGLKALNALSTPNQTISTIQKGLSKYGQAMSYLGETSEVAFRLSVYERSKNNGIKEYKEKFGEEPKGQDLKDIINQSVREARETIDFSQGGSTVKAIDNVAPYLNAATQGFRKAIDFAVNDPKSFALSMGQLMLMSASFMAGSLAMLLKFKDDDDNIEDILNSISDYEKANYYILFTGGKDEDGAYSYIRIKKLPGTSAFVNLAEFITTKAIMESRGIKYDGSNKVLIQSLENIAPIIPSVGNVINRNPVASGLISYATNYDFFYDQPIFRSPSGKDIAPYAQGLYDDKVEEIYKKLGLLTEGWGWAELSPIKTQKLMEKIFTSESTNPNIGLIYSGFDLIAKDDTTFAKEISNTWEGFTGSVSKKLYRKTNPNLLTYQKEAASKQEMQKIDTDEYNSESKIYEAIRKRYTEEKGSFTQQEFISLIKENFKDPIDWKQKSDKFMKVIANRDISRDWVGLMYETDPQKQAYKLFTKFGDQLDSEEFSDLKIIEARLGRKISEKSLAIYVRDYKKK